MTFRLYLTTVLIEKIITSVVLEDREARQLFDEYRATFYPKPFNAELADSPFLVFENEDDYLMFALRFC